jgi:hypothetical protein
MTWPLFFDERFIDFIACPFVLLIFIKAVDVCAGIKYFIVRGNPQKAFTIAKKIINNSMRHSFLYIVINEIQLLCLSKNAAAGKYPGDEGQRQLFFLATNQHELKMMSLKLIKNC